VRHREIYNFFDFRDKPKSHYLKLPFKFFAHSADNRDTVGPKPRGEVSHRWLRAADGFEQQSDSLEERLSHCD